jgi:phosphoglycerate dehydrogenase-like enzyme
MRVLATGTAWDQFGERQAKLARPVEVLRMDDRGDITGPDGPLAWEDAGPEVVWATPDLFDEGAPLRPFFGFVRRCDSMRWLQSAAAGVDAPIFGEVLRRGIRLTTSHATAVPVAEYTLRAVLSHYQRDDEWRTAQAEREWRRHELRELHGSTWVVVGVGAIGAAVAARAGAFGVHVVGVRRNPVGNEPVAELVAPDQLPEVLPRADVVVLALPATRSTEDLVDTRFLAAMRPGSVLVNVARGTIVDEDALLDALDRGVPELAVLDVVVDEPLPPNSRLWSHPRVRLTPHNAAHGSGRHDRAADLFLENLTRYQAGQPLLHQVGEGDLGDA